MDDRKLLVQSPSKTREFSVLQNLQTTFGVNHTFAPVIKTVSFFRGKSGRAWSWPLTPVYSWQ